MPATKTKTAGDQVEEKGMRGLQLDTSIDREDYGTEAEIVNKIKSDVAGAAADGTPELGSQVHSQNQDDKSYSQSGSGAAKLANKDAMAAVIAIAGKNPAAAARFVMAFGEGEGVGPTGDKGTMVGGEPDSVAAGEAAAAGDAAPAPDAGAASGTAPQLVPQDDVTKSKLQETIDDKQHSMDIQKQVVQELSKVLDDVTTARRKQAADKDEKAKKEKADKEKEDKEKEKAKKDKEASLRRTAGGTADEREPKKDEQGGGVVPHASIDPDNHPQKDGDPDKTGFDVYTAASDKTGEGHAGQAFAESGDRDYKLSIKNLQTKVASAKQVLSAEVQKLIKSGNTIEQALSKLAQTAFGKKLSQAVKELKALEKKASDDGNNRDVAGNVPPNEITTKSADETVRYDAKERGDDKADEIAPGSDVRLESPETRSVVDEARGKLTPKHNEDTAGSTVAFKLDDKVRSKIAAEVGTVKNAINILGQITKDVMVHLAVKDSRDAVTTAIQRTTEHMQQVVAKTDKLLQKQSHSMAERGQLASLVHEAQALVVMAKNQAILLKAQMKEASYHRAKFARISPSFKLAVNMVQAGTIRMNELATTVAEFVRMSPEEFQASEKMAIKIAARQPMQSRTASRLPSVTTASVLESAPADELDGIFND